MSVKPAPRSAAGASSMSASTVAARLAASAARSAPKNKFVSADGLSDSDEDEVPVRAAAKPKKASTTASIDSLVTAKPSKGKRAADGDEFDWSIVTSKPAPSAAAPAAPAVNAAAADDDEDNGALESALLLSDPEYDSYLSPSSTLTKPKRDPSVVQAERKAQQKEAALRAGIRADPSLRYFNQPLRIPMISEAKYYFSDTLTREAYAASSLSSSVTPALNTAAALAAARALPAPVDGVPAFPVFIGPTTGWRSQVKLAVRAYGSAALTASLVSKKEAADAAAAAGKKVAMRARLSRREQKLLNASKSGIEQWERPQIGMFEPNSHTIVPGIAMCPAHCKGIETALDSVEKAINACRTIGYNDSDGSGNLRFVAMQVVQYPAYVSAPEDEGPDAPAAIAAAAADKAAEEARAAADAFAAAVAKVEARKKKEADKKAKAKAKAAKKAKALAKAKTKAKIKAAKEARAARAALTGVPVERKRKKDGDDSDSDSSSSSSSSSSSDSSSESESESESDYDEDATPPKSLKELSSASRIAAAAADVAAAKAAKAARAARGRMVPSSKRGKVQLTIVWNDAGSDADKPASFDTPAIPNAPKTGAAGLRELAKSDAALAKLLKELLRDHSAPKKGGKKGDKKKGDKKDDKKDGDEGDDEGTALPDSHPVWHSLWVHRNNAWSHTNAIFSYDPNAWQHIFGPEDIVETMPLPTSALLKPATVGRKGVNAVPFSITAAAEREAERASETGEGFSSSNQKKTGDRIVADIAAEAAAEQEAESAALTAAGAVLSALEGKNKKVKFGAEEPKGGESKRVKFGDSSSSSSSSKVVSLAAPTPGAGTPAGAAAAEASGSLGITVPYRSLPSPALRFPPTVFRQANLDGFSAIIASVRPFIPLGSHVIELYGGVGTIGLNLADRVASLVCSDENPHNARCFKDTVESMPAAIKAGRALKYVSKGASAMVEAGALCRSLAFNHDVFPDPSAKTATTATSGKRTPLPPPTVCIVDPPRKGLSNDVLAALATPKGAGQTSGPTLRAGAPAAAQTSALNRLVYISCGFKALQRDCAALVGPGGGGWKVAHAEGHVLFPGSDHLETLVVFVR